MSISNSSIMRRSNRDRKQPEIYDGGRRCRPQEGEGRKRRRSLLDDEDDKGEMMMSSTDDEEQEDMSSSRPVDFIMSMEEKKIVDFGMVLEEEEKIVDYTMSQEEKNLLIRRSQGGRPRDHTDDAETPPVKRIALGLGVTKLGNLAHRFGELLKVRILIAMTDSLFEIAIMCVTFFSRLRFFFLQKSRASGGIYMKDAVEILGATHRRMYEISNVLQGADLITVHHKEQKYNNRTVLHWTQNAQMLHHSNKNAQMLQHSNKKLQAEEKQLDKWMKELQESKNKRKGSNNNKRTKTLMYITKDDLLKQRQGGVDLILAPQQGSVLYIPPPTSIKSYSLRVESPPKEMVSSDATAYLLEDDGHLKTLELGVLPLPLLASCCSDFSITNLEAAPPTACCSDFSITHLEPPPLTACSSDNSDWEF